MGKPGSSGIRKSGSGWSSARMPIPYMASGWPKSAALRNARLAMSCKSLSGMFIPCVMVNAATPNLYHASFSPSMRTIQSSQKAAGAPELGGRPVFSSSLVRAAKAKSALKSPFNARSRTSGASSTLFFRYTSSTAPYSGAQLLSGNCPSGAIYSKLLSVRNKPSA